MIIESSNAAEDEELYRKFRARENIRSCFVLIFHYSFRVRSIPAITVMKKEEFSLFLELLPVITARFLLCVMTF